MLIQQSRDGDKIHLEKLSRDRNQRNVRVAKPTMDAKTHNCLFNEQSPLIFNKRLSFNNKNGKDENKRIY